MGDEALAKRVAARWVLAQQEDDDEPHDPSDGVLHKWQLDSLQDKRAWKGYSFYVSTWTWRADVYEDQDEPDDWGNGTKQGPVMTLDEVLEALGKTPFKWVKLLSSTESDFIESTPKKTKATVTQGHASIERLDGKPLSYEERKHLTRTLKLKN